MDQTVHAFLVPRSSTCMRKKIVTCKADLTPTLPSHSGQNALPLIGMSDASEGEEATPEIVVPSKVVRLYHPKSIGGAGFAPSFPSVLRFPASISVRA